MRALKLREKQLELKRALDGILDPFCSSSFIHRQLARQSDYQGSLPLICEHPAPRDHAGPAGLSEDSGPRTSHTASRVFINSQQALVWIKKDFSKAKRELATIVQFKSIKAQPKNPKHLTSRTNEKVDHAVESLSRKKYISTLKKSAQKNHAQSSHSQSLRQVTGQPSPSNFRAKHTFLNISVIEKPEPPKCSISSTHRASRDQAQARVLGEVPVGRQPKRIEFRSITEENLRRSAKKEYSKILTEAEADRLCPWRSQKKDPQFLSGLYL